MTSTPCARAIAVLVFALAAAARATAQFSLDALRERARDLRSKKFSPRSADDLPAWLAKLDFDRYRNIHFRPEVTLWSAERLPFELQFAHRGYLFPYRLPIHVVGEGGAVAETRFDPRQFEYRLEAPQPVPEQLGYAGLRVLVPLGAERRTEVATFLGATYFRLVGDGQRYGASARGLAIDTASPRGEEFPEFVEMWVARPQADAKELELYALLDSASATGAYRFTLTPGEQTVVDVSAWLYPRRDVDKLGLAPLTSMFLYGEQRLAWFADFRPEVHDSDGVLLADEGERWLWRPLSNPRGEHRVSRLSAAQPQGFGLLQRDREFEHYQDLEARFERRASYWVTPRDAWPRGWLELVEIPSDAERNDNIALYWVPERAPRAGEELAFRYTLSSFLDDPRRPPLARVLATRVQPAEASALFVLDFDGPRVADAQTALVGQVEASAGEVRHVVLQPNEVAGGTRLTFELAGARGAAVELRAWLQQGERRVSETWLYPWKQP